MLATVGFLVTGLLFYAFAMSVYSFATKKTRLFYKQYAVAYGVVAVTFVIWSFACAIGYASTLARAVMVGDVGLVFSTVLMLRILVDKKHQKVATWVGSLIGFGLLVLRYVRYYPVPYMRNSILVFNSPRFVSFVLASVFLLIWFPVNLRVARMITEQAKMEVIRNSYTILYATATLSAAIFLLAKKPLTLALTFIAISLCFLALTFINMMLSNSTRRHHARQSS